MTDPRPPSAAARRDAKAIVEAVADELELPPGPLAVCAQALVVRRLAGDDTSPAIARVVAEELTRLARACKACGDVHHPRRAAPRPGDLPLLTWAALDGHPYEETARPAAYWLDKILQEGA